MTKDTIQSSKFYQVYETLSAVQRGEFSNFMSYHFKDKKEIYKDILLIFEKAKEAKTKEERDLCLNKLEPIYDKSNKAYNRYITDLTHYLHKYIVYSELTSENKEVTEANLIADLQLLKYYRNHLPERVKEVLDSFKQDLKKFPNRNWIYYYYNYKYWAYQLEYVILNDDTHKRDLNIEEAQKNCSNAFQIAWTSKYFYRNLINPSDKGELADLKAVVSDYIKENAQKDSEEGALANILLKVEELLQDNTPSSFLDKCLALFPSQNGQPETTIQKQFALLSHENRQNFCRLFIRHLGALSNNDKKYYSDLFDYHLACFQQGYLLVNNYMNSKEYRNLLVAYMYKHEEKAIQEMKKQRLFKWLESSIKELFSDIKIYQKNTQKQIPIIVGARFLLENEDFRQISEKVGIIPNDNTYRVEALFLLMYAHFEEDLRHDINHKRNFKESKNKMNHIKEKKLEMTPLYANSLVAFGFLLNFAEKRNETERKKLTDFLSKNKVYLKHWMRNKVNALSI